MEHIQTDEEVMFRLPGTGTGPQVTRPNGTIETLPTPQKGAPVLLITDRRLVYVGGAQRHIRELAYDTLVTAEWYSGTGDQQI